MMDVQVANSTPQSMSMAEYAADLARGGMRVLPGAAGTFWAEYQPGAMMRIPS